GGQHGDPDGGQVAAERRQRHRYGGTEQASGGRLQEQQREYRVPEGDLRTGPERGEQRDRHRVQDDEVSHRTGQAAQRPPADGEQYAVAEQRDVQYGPGGGTPQAPEDRRG